MILARLQANLINMGIDGECEVIPVGHGMYPSGYESLSLLEGDLILRSPRDDVIEFEVLRGGWYFVLDPAHLFAEVCWCLGLQEHPPEGNASTPWEVTPHSRLAERFQREGKQLKRPSAFIPGWPNFS